LQVSTLPARQPPLAFPRERTQRGGRHVLPISLLVSTLIHALVVGMPFRVDVTDEDRGPRRNTAPPTSPAALKVLNLRVTAETTAAPTTESTDSVEHREKAPAEAGPADDAAGLPAPSQGQGLGTLFRPRAVDPRLWSVAPSILADRTAPERAQLRTQLEVINRKAEGVRVPPGEDMSLWTGRDTEGDRWGLSPGAIHLGGFTLPLCSGRFDASSCGFGVQPVFRDRYQAELRTLIESQRQGARAELMDRARALRARLDSLRDSIPPLILERR